MPGRTALWRRSRQGAPLSCGPRSSARPYSPELATILWRREGNKCWLPWSPEWTEFRPRLTPPLDPDNIDERIDNAVASLRGAQIRNFVRFPKPLTEELNFDPEAPGEASWPAPPSVYEDHIAYLKSKLRARIEWIDANISSLFDRVVPPPSIVRPPGL